MMLNLTFNHSATKPLIFPYAWKIFHRSSTLPSSLKWLKKNKKKAPPVANKSITSKTWNQTRLCHE